MLRLKPTIQIFFAFIIVLAILPTLTFAQSNGLFECDATPPTLEDPEDWGCSIRLVETDDSDPAQYTIEFTAIAGGCIPTLTGSSLNEAGREIQLVLEDLTPPELGCTTDIKIYTVISDPFQLSNGDWEVEVLLKDQEDLLSTYTRTVSVQPEIVIDLKAIYLPIVKN